MNLNPAQMQYKDALEWLASDHITHRATGRSHLLALVFIEQAMSKPGIWINVWDHGPHHPKKEIFMLRQIQKIIEDEYKDWSFSMNHLEKSFALRRK